MTSNLSPACAGFVERLNGVLDGDLAQSSLAADAHLAACNACQGRLAAAAMLAAIRPFSTSPAPGFTERTLARIHGDQRVQRRQRVLVRVGGFALAASVLVAIWSLWPAPPQAVRIVELTPPGVVKPITDARDAIVSITTKVADDSLAPARNLFSVKAAVKPPAPIDASRPLDDLPEAAAAGFEPLVSTPRRALNLFFRDVGGAAGARKANS